MKLRKRIISTFILLAVLSQFTSNVQAQVWEVDVYGCITPGFPKAIIVRKDVLLKTGWENLDAAIIQDIAQLSELFGVYVPVYFRNEKWKRAQYIANKFPELLRDEKVDPNTTVHGSVFISLELLIDEFKQANGRTIAVPAILGHEYAHAKQRFSNFPFKGKWKELHADFMAGWYIAYRERTHLDVQDLLPLLKSFFRKGDEGFFSVDPHGTGAERLAAVAAGFGYGFYKNTATGDDAYRAAIKYIKFFGAK